MADEVAATIPIYRDLEGADLEISLTEDRQTAGDHRLAVPFGHFHPPIVEGERSIRAGPLFLSDRDAVRAPIDSDVDGRIVGWLV